MMSKKIKVLSVFGTRPEAIKMVPLVKELNSRENIDSIVCITAQHRQMLDQVLNMFNITPEYDLDIMKDSQSLADITTGALQGLYTVIQESNPDIVLVHGDTTTTLAGSLAAFYNKVKLGHVEAGLRTFNNYSPYPEEVNRRLTGVVADLHFAPTATNKRNLLAEGTDESKIYVTGNTVIDALTNTVSAEYEFANKTLASLNTDKKLILLTAHRRENWGEPLENICHAVKNIALDYASDVHFIYPVHLNPIVRNTVYELLDGIPNISLIDPLGVADLHNIMARSYFVMTDSGGLQEEAPSLGKPVLVLRQETERPEAVEAGTVQIIGTEEDEIVKGCAKLLNDKMIYDKMAESVNPYGDGQASSRIADAIEYEFGIRKHRSGEFI